MPTKPGLQFKIAAIPEEFEAIFRLNYRTFVEEIPQHATNTQGRLIDRFHAENVYVICLNGLELAGMICGRTARPFSLDQKLPNLDQYLPAGGMLVEVRLLAVEPVYRQGAVFCGLVRQLAQHFHKRGCDLALISGTTRQLRLYRHLGFVPFGPLVGTAQAQYQPMYLTLKTFIESAPTLAPGTNAGDIIEPPA